MHIKVEFDFGQRKCVYEAESVQLFKNGVAFDDFVWLGDKLGPLAKSFFALSCDCLRSFEETIREVNDDL